ncbi:MAG: H+-translocating transhydrogenase subunit beta [Candidatus Hydrogenedentes bacterium]|nr:H+-translocating transhydrogenase subunit beta [Candidatus Hydrogenedentota bacterium]
MSVYNVIALVLVGGVLLGIRWMNSPRTAVAGNLLGALCMFGAILLTLSWNGILTRPLLWASMAVGTGLGYVLAARVAMIQMPQMVALLNGLGGGASAAVALVFACETAMSASFASRFSGSLALAVGSLTLTGSLVAAGKLAGRLAQRPLVLRHHGAMGMGLMAVTAVAMVLAALQPGPRGVLWSLVALLASGAFGSLMTARVVGADMPITISLLNSLSGVAASIAGFAVRDPLLVAIGAIVGASGLLLTQIMCRAMNRSLLQVLYGGSGALAAARVEPAAEPPADTPKPPACEKPPVEVLLRQASRVTIVPGYGMALAQAQEEVKGLLDTLEGAGKSVQFAIHPVAGRMPGHMHVLLAEVDVPYEQLVEIDAANAAFKEMDLVIVIGANDVVNPAAATAEGTPIYGMPVLHVAEARHIVVCNMDAKPGYAGVENSLYAMDHVTLLLGDAKETVRALAEAVRGSEAA